jgi:capsular polysaccharide biosynthesis protein
LLEAKQKAEEEKQAAEKQKQLEKDSSSTMKIGTADEKTETSKISTPDNVPSIQSADTYHNILESDVVLKKNKVEVVTTPQSTMKIGTTNEKTETPKIPVPDNVSNTQLSDTRNNILESDVVLEKNKVEVGITKQSASENLKRG